MKKNSKQRTEEEAKFLEEAFHTIKFFTEVKEEISQELILKLYKELKHEFFTKKSRVFEIGDPGSKFYIILKGSVYVLLEKSGFKKDDVEESFDEHDRKFSSEEFKLLDNILSKREIEESAVVEESEKEKALLYLKKQLRELERNYSKKAYSDKDSLLISKFIRKLQKLDLNSKNINYDHDRIKFHEDFLNILNDKDYLSLIYPELVIAKQLNIGDSFGELALRRSIPRFFFKKILIYFFMKFVIFVFF